MCFAVPDLANDQTWEKTILLSILSTSSFVAPAPNIEILSGDIDGTLFVLDFKETTSAPDIGFILRGSKDMSEDSASMWDQVPLPYTIFPDRNRFNIPVDMMMCPSRYFVIQPVAD